MRCVRNYFTVSLYIYQGFYILKISIIVDSGLNINVVNQRSLLKCYENSTPNENICIKNHKALIKRYKDVFMKIFISSKKKINLIIRILRL